MSKPFVQLVAVLCLALPTPTFGFNAAGHKIIADIAWQKLPPAQRQAIAAIIKSHPRFDEDFEDDMPSQIHGTANEDHWIFCHAATWPDIARGIPLPDRNQYHRARWHYINLPVFLNGSEAAAFSGGVSANTSFSPQTASNEELLNGVQAVKNSLAIIASPSTSDEEKAVHYCWLLHVIPDLAQPLHSASLFTTQRFPDGDKGGNSIKIRRVGTSGSGKKLHAVWDGLLGTNSSFNSIRGKAQQLIAAHQSDFDAPLEDLPDDAWSRDSLQHALQTAYEPILAAVANAEGGGHLGTIEVPQSYFQDAGKLTERQAVVAGVRLAAVLASTVPAAGQPTPLSPHALGFPAAVSNQRLPAVAPQAAVSAARQPIDGAATAELLGRIEQLEAEVRELRRSLGATHAVGAVPARAMTLSAARNSSAEDDGEQCTCGMDE